MKRDKRDLFRFAALQSEKAKSLINKFNFDSTKLESVVLITRGNIFTGSTAALIICKHLSGAIKIFYSLIILPKFIRDFFYNLIAKNRLKLFGRRDSCRIPTDKETMKFLS